LLSSPGKKIQNNKKSISSVSEGKEEEEEEEEEEGYEDGRNEPPRVHVDERPRFGHRL